MTECPECGGPALPPGGTCGEVFCSRHGWNDLPEDEE